MTYTSVGMQLLRGREHIGDLATPQPAAAIADVLEYFPELADESLAEDDAPSCSVAEALERQSLFVNRVIASHALALLFDLLGRGSIGHAGSFINLATGQAVPIPLPRVEVAA